MRDRSRRVIDGEDGGVTLTGRAQSLPVQQQVADVTLAAMDKWDSVAVVYAHIKPEQESERRGWEWMSVYGHGYVKRLGHDDLTSICGLMIF